MVRAVSTNSLVGVRTEPMSERILLVFTGLLIAPSITAQQVLEVDYSSGRTIINNEWRAMRSADLVVDRGRDILYVYDAEEPEGVMAFSLETGEWVRTISTPNGDGPHEFSQGRVGMAVGSDGSFYAAGFLRVVTFNLLGEPVNSWRPDAPMRSNVCAMGGAPAIPIVNGVLRHVAGEEDEVIGPNAVAGVAIPASSVAEGTAIGKRIMDARIACTESAAFVVMKYDDGPDSVFAYYRSGEARRLAVPAEYTEGFEDCEQKVRTRDGRLFATRACPTWNQNLYPSVDDRGNLVLFGHDATVAGAIVDPGSGCYALVRKKPPDDSAMTPVRVLGDSCAFR